MKQIILMTAISFLATPNIVPQDKDQHLDRLRLMLVDGEVLQIRDRDQIRLNDQLTLLDSAIANPEGTCQKKSKVLYQEHFRI
jgi:hypothetical protein